LLQNLNYSRSACKWRWTNKKRKGRGEKLPGAGKHGCGRQRWWKVAGAAAGRRNDDDSRRWHDCLSFFSSMQSPRYLFFSSPRLFSLFLCCHSSKSSFSRFNSHSLISLFSFSFLFLFFPLCYVPLILFPFSVFSFFLSALSLSCLSLLVSLFSSSSPAPLSSSSLYL